MEERDRPIQRQPSSTSKLELENLITSTRQELTQTHPDDERFLQVKKRLIDYELKLEQMFGGDQGGRENLSPFLPPRRKIPDEEMDPSAGNQRQRRSSMLSSMLASSSLPHTPKQQQVILFPSILAAQEPAAGSQESHRQASGDLDPSQNVEDRVKRIQSILDEKSRGNTQ